MFVVWLIRLYPNWELEPSTDPARFNTPKRPGEIVRVVHDEPTVEMLVSKELKNVS